MPNDQLPAVPRRRRTPPPADPTPPDHPSGNADGQGQPDLSNIAADLRFLAVPIGELQFDPRNARKHGEKNLKAIEGSLAVYGQRRPVVYRRDTKVVLAGNGVLQSALSLGWTHLAAIAVDDDDSTAAGYAIADNRTAELAEWDRDALNQLLHEAFTGADERLDAALADLAEAQQLIPADPPPEPTPPPAEEFKLLILCQSAEQQAEVLERLAGEGYDCRSLIT